MCYYLLPIICQWPSSCSVTFSRPFWRIRWWMRANSINGQNASCCSHSPVSKVLWACPLPHWCYVNWLNTQKLAIDHVTPIERKWVWTLKLTCWHQCKKMGQIKVEIDATQMAFYKWSGKYRLGCSFLERRRRKKHNKLSHICIFCYDRVVLHEHLGGRENKTQTQEMKKICLFKNKHFSLWTNYPSV